MNISITSQHNIVQMNTWNTIYLTAEKLKRYEDTDNYRSYFTAAVVHITAMIDYVFISFCAVQIYGLSSIHFHSSPSTGILRAEHCTGIAKVMGSNPVQAWMFFQAFISQLLSCLYNYDDHLCLHKVTLCQQDRLNNIISKSIIRQNKTKTQNIK